MFHLYLCYKNSFYECMIGIAWPQERLLKEHSVLDFPALRSDSLETIFDYLVDENG